MRYLLSALQFLTILPSGASHSFKDHEYPKTLLWFPVVGTMLAFALILVSNLMMVLPGGVTAALILAASALLTGGLHLDGFADTCDGMGGGRTRENILEIMRDSRIGTFGATGLIMLLIIKYACYSSFDNISLGKALLVSMTFSRYSQVLAASFYKYARAEGKAKLFMAGRDKAGIWVGGVYTFVVMASVMGMSGFMLFAAGLGIVALAGKYISSKIGGMTGDTIGFISEMTELFMLVTVSLRHA